MAESKANRPNTILVVDDDHIDRRAVQRALPADFFALEAVNSAETLDLLQQQAIDCVLLDYDIPGTNTLQLLEAICHQVPVVVLTGRGDEAVAVAVMKAGALDYMSKSSLCKEMLERVVRQAIDKANHRHEHKFARQRVLTEYHTEKRKRHELETAMHVARDIQLRLIPTSPPHFEGFDIAGVYLPAESASGDFFDYLPMPDGTLGVVIADVSDHGIGAALLATEIRAHLRALSQANADIGQIMTIANRLFFEDTTGDRSATICWIKLDAQTKSLTYASAGHRAFIAQPAGATIVLEGTTVPLGLEKNTQIPVSQRYSLATGDVVLLVTDGITERMSPVRDLFGSDRCLEVVRLHRSEPAERIVDQILLAARLFAQSEPQHDDIAIVVVKVR